jgi:hypothetical protein
MKSSRAKKQVCFTKISVFSTLALLGASCSDMKSAVRKCEQTGSCGVKSANTTAPEVGTVVSLTASEKAAAYGKELKLLEAWNVKLCEKVNETRLTCKASYPLIANKTGNILGCNPAAGGAIIEAKFTAKAKAAGPNGQDIPLKFEVNEGKYVANPNTNMGEITWEQVEASNSLVPRLVDLVSFRLTDKDGAWTGDFKSSAMREFELKLNGQTFLTKDDLKDSADGGVVVNAEKLTALKNGPGCKVDSKTTDELRAKAAAEIETLSPQELSKGLSDTEANGAIPNLEGSVERERGRQRGLLAAMGIDPMLGCWQDVPLRSLVVTVDGSPAGNNGDIRLDESASAPKEGQGSSQSYTFQFSDSLKINAANSAQGTVFKPEGKITNTDLSKSSLKIGSLQFLKITKNGYSYDSTSNQNCGNGFLGIGASCSTRFINTETNVTFLSRIRIMANDQLVYDRDGINHTFQKSSLQFKDTDFKNNKAWRSLLTRADCQVSTPAK